ncbi:MAG: nitronate monooxygenase [Legionella sp.]|nr:nitronate monooxygenase [Legionella sp.]
MPSRINDFAQKFLLRAPLIIQAPMAGGITTPKLVAAVSNADALGSFATGYLNTQAVKEGIREIKKLTTKPYAVNVFVPNAAKMHHQDIQGYQRALNVFRRQLDIAEEHQVLSPILPADNFNEIIEVLLKEEVPIVSFTFGNLPNDIIKVFKQNGTYLIGTATSLKEAEILAESNVDAIVAQGAEAGGHRGSFFSPFKNATIGTIVLVRQMVKYINKPIIAAGGIMDGQGIMAATVLGASAVQMGTAFLALKESGANSFYQEQLLKAKNSKEDITTLTNAYSGKTARGIHTEFIDYMQTHVANIPDYPIAHELSSPLRKAAAKKGVTNYMSMWCGQGASLIENRLSVDAFIKKLREEIEESLADSSRIELNVTGM